MKRKREPEFDILKGIGIILMIMAHTYGPDSILWRIVYPFHMPLFFIVSGYFFKQKTTSIVINTSFNRLIKPYLFICIAIISIKYLQHLNNPHINLLDIKSILNGIGPGWFLLSLFWCRIFFNYIIKIAPHTYIYLVISIFISTIVVFSFPYFPIDINLAIPQGLTCLLFIAIGYFIKQKNILTKIQSSAYLKYLSLLISILFWLITFTYGQVEISQCIFKLWIIDYLGAIGGTFFCYHIAKYIINYSNILSTLLYRISQYSIAILSFHAIDYTIFLWHHLDGFIIPEYQLTSIAIGRLIIVFLSIFITSRIPFLYHLFVGKDKLNYT